MASQEDSASGVKTATPRVKFKDPKRCSWEENYSNQTLSGIEFRKVKSDRVVHFISIYPEVILEKKGPFRISVKVEEDGSFRMPAKQTFEEMIQAKRRQQNLLYNQEKAASILTSAPSTSTPVAQPAANTTTLTDLAARRVLAAAARRRQRAAAALRKQQEAAAAAAAGATGGAANTSNSNGAPQAPSAPTVKPQPVATPKRSSSSRRRSSSSRRRPSSRRPTPARTPAQPTESKLPIPAPAPDQSPVVAAEQLLKKTPPKRPSKSSKSSSKSKKKPLTIPDSPASSVSLSIRESCSRSSADPTPSTSKRVVTSLKELYKKNNTLASCDPKEVKMLIRSAPPGSSVVLPDGTILKKSRRGGARVGAGRKRSRPLGGDQDLNTSTSITSSPTASSQHNTSFMSNCSGDGLQNGNSL